MTTDALAFLCSLERFGVKLGLENISRLSTALGHPERAFQSVLIGGTNGKGSTAAMVHHALVSAGHNAGRYTSPHLERLEERYVVSDREVTTAELTAAAEAVCQVALSLQHEGVLTAPPTFFECATAMAFEIFRRAAVRIAVLEVGLGGRLDATNVVDPVAAAITSIDLDHEAQLGHTIEAIAFEKAGIIRPGIPVVCGDMAPAAERVIVERCAERSARFVRAAGGLDLADLTAGAPLALRGAHQLGNARVAACLLRELDALGVRVDAAAIRSGLTEARWPGRLEVFRYQGCDVLVDAAHNPAGVRALAAYLRESGWRDAALVFGATRDKDASTMLTELAPLCAAIVCTTAATPRAAPAEALAALARTAGTGWTISAVPDPEAALSAATARYSRVVVAGSIFLIGPVRGILRRR